jgi:hypothetical protein
MASITSFICTTPLASLRVDFNPSGIGRPTAPDWEGPEPPHAAHGRSRPYCVPLRLRHHGPNR